MVPARQNTGSWRQSQPGWRQRLGREAGERLRALWCVVGTVPLGNLPIVSCTWDRGLCCPGTVLFGFGFLVPSDSLILAQERADLNLGWIQTPEHLKKMQLTEGATGKGHHACNLFLNSSEKKFMEKRRHVYVCWRQGREEREGRREKRK